MYISLLFLIYRYYILKYYFYAEYYLKKSDFLSIIRNFIKNSYLIFYDRENKYSLLEYHILDIERNFK